MNISQHGGIQLCNIFAQTGFASFLLLVPAAVWRLSRLEASKGNVVSKTAINGDLCNVKKSPSVPLLHLNRHKMADNINA